MLWYIINVNACHLDDGPNLHSTIDDMAFIIITIEVILLAHVHPYVFRLMNEYKPTEQFID